jgi:hypothetical protein
VYRSRVRSTLERSGTLRFARGPGSRPAEASRPWPIKLRIRSSALRQRLKWQRPASPAQNQGRIPPIPSGRDDRGHLDPVLTTTNPIRATVVRNTLCGRAGGEHVALRQLLSYEGQPSKPAPWTRTASSSSPSKGDGIRRQHMNHTHRDPAHPRVLFTFTADDLAP